MEVEEKRLLAAHSASLIKPSQKIFPDEGSTCLSIADLIRENCDLFVITHSVDSLKVLRTGPGFTLIALAGEYEEKLAAFVGPAAEHQLS